MKGEKEKAKRKKRGEEKKEAMVALLVFILVNLDTYLAVTFSKIRLDLYVY